MKKRKELETDELRPEYDWSKSWPSPFAKDFKRDVVVVILDEELSKAYPTPAKARRALRAAMKTHRKKGATSRSAA